MIVQIPSKKNHEGNPKNLVTVEINDYCPHPKCGKPRGLDLKKMKSYDGGRFLTVDSWRNGCRHLDNYEDLIKEAAEALLSGYILVNRRGFKAIKCLRCQLESFNFNDISQKYCGFCNIYHHQVHSYLNATP